MGLSKRKENLYRERAARGARLLDERRPGWWRVIRTTRLDMEEGLFDPDDRESCGCVAAQLSSRYAADIEGTGDYCNGLYEVVRIRFGKPEVMYGFNISAADNLTGREPEVWSVLDEAWTDEVRARRKAAA